MIKTRFTVLLVLIAMAAVSIPVSVAPQEPIRIYVRSGPKSHGPGAHDYPRFLKEWVPLLNERGAKASGGDTFPTKAQLDETDVVILHKQEAGNVDAPDRQNLDEYLARGGGLVVIHAGIVTRDPDWFRGIVGGTWRNGTTRWREGPMQLHFTDRNNPITKGASDWEMDDEIYYNMDILPESKILATSPTPKPGGEVEAQMWTYEKTTGSKPYRAFVMIPGHLYENFNRPSFRATLLRGIAWAGKRTNVDELVKKEDLADAPR